MLQENPYNALINRRVNNLEKHVNILFISNIVYVISIVTFKVY